MATVLTPTEAHGSRDVAFSDAVRDDLVRYTHGDEDREWAIRNVVGLIPSEAKRIVHIGCGIGWLAHEAKRGRPDAVVVGIDPSGSAVEIASTLFGRDGLAYHVGLPGEPGGPERAPADVLIVSAALDSEVLGQHSGIARSIGTAARPGAVVLLDLRTRRRGGPDLAGEVTPASRSLATWLDGLAAQLGATLMPRHAVSAVRGSAVAGLELPPGGPPTPKAVEGTIPLEDLRSRGSRTRSRLGVRVTPDGYLIPVRSGPAVLLVTPTRNAPSETFVRAEIERLPPRMEVLFGSFPHLEDEDGRRLTPRWARGVGRVLDVIVPGSSDRIHARWLGRFIRTHGIVAMLAVYGPTGASLVPFCSRASIPLVTQFLGFDATDSPTIERFRPGYARLFAEATAIVAVSHDIARRLSDLGARPERVHRIPCGVDVDRFEGADPGANPPVFLAAGRFVEKKAPHLTLLAFSRVLSEAPQARLQMVGDGPLLGACQQLARGLGVTGTVEFLGYRSHDELASLMRGARAFVQHSMVALSGDSEGLPVAVLEAGAAGLPVVATRHGGIPEAVIDGETGYLVDEGDVDSMTDRMSRLAHDPALATRLGSRAREHVQGGYALSDTLEQLWSVVSEAMSRRTGSRWG